MMAVETLPLGLALEADGDDAEREADGQQDPAEDERAGDAGEEEPDRGHGESNDAQHVALRLLLHRRRITLIGGLR